MSATELRDRFAQGLLWSICEAKEKKNFVVSPLGLGSVLAMLYSGLYSTTKKELRKPLCAHNETRLHAMYKAVMTAECRAELKLAVRVLADSKWKIQPSFQKLLQDIYESKVEVRDFATKSAEVRKEMNKWIEDNTENMIKELLGEGTIDGSTICVLLSAVYFKGAWFEDFDKLKDPHDFTSYNGVKEQGDAITKESRKLVLAETNEFTLVKIPYGKGNFYMLVALPSGDAKIDEVLPGCEFVGMIKAVKEAEGKAENKRPPVTVIMPKFEIHYECSAKEILKEFGVKQIFEPEEKGGFDGLFVRDTPEKMDAAILVSHIAHKSAIVVDEKGTTASSGSAVVVGVKSPRPTVVNLNKPFGFFIMTSHDLVCFAGVFYGHKM